MERNTDHNSAHIPAALRNLVEVLRWRALDHPDRPAYTFLADGEAQEVVLTHGELDRRARRVGAWLQSLGARGERVLLLYPPGLDYIAAFMGCLYAGAVAVPAYPPRFNRNLIRLQAIVDDAGATLALTTPSILSDIERNAEHAPGLRSLRWLTLEGVTGGSAGDYREISFTDESLAFLQYTSGSTSTPKGVMVSHGNLFGNSALIQKAFGTTPDSRCVIWLPPYHDMGLIGGILQPLFAGFHVTLMPPVAFLQRPLKWLQVISRVKGTLSGGPNFAYDLCARKAKPEHLATLDLSSWETAFNGAEPIRPETLERFARTFEPCGFRREAFFPCYGLAEATLIVTGARRSTPPAVGRFEASALEQNRVVETSAAGEGFRALVGCGPSVPGQQVVIVDPETRTRRGPGQVGEIWVSGQSVALGYLNRPEQTEQTFKAYLADTGEGPYLRTGDLGFLRGGELFVTGRLKDLLIIRGQNHYPQDIEWTVQQSHPALRADCGAVFVSEEFGEERLVVVQEVERAFRNLNAEEVAGAIRRAVAETHGLQVSAVQLIKTGSIPKTTSGKIQRHACRAAFTERTLNCFTPAGGAGVTNEASVNAGASASR